MSTPPEPPSPTAADPWIEQHQSGERPNFTVKPVRPKWPFVASGFVVAALVIGLVVVWVDQEHDSAAEASKLDVVFEKVRAAELPCSGVRINDVESMKFDDLVEAGSCESTQEIAVGYWADANASLVGSALLAHALCAGKPGTKDVLNMNNDRFSVTVVDPQVEFADELVDALGGRVNVLECRGRS